LADLCRAHQTTLVFVNTRRLAERAAKHLSERLGEDNVSSHHGSLARAHRLDAETRLKDGRLSALVATASLELGIDIGDVDLVCQLGSPGAIAAFLQRVGRSGHALDAVPKGRLFPLSRDDLVEAAAILDAVHRGELEQIVFPTAPLDVLAQHLVAEVASEPWSETDLLRMVQRAHVYRALSRDTFADVVRMLAQGFSTRRGRRGAYIHHDRVNQWLRERRGARLAAVTNAGAIPDLFDYDVVLMPSGHSVGTLNEDFAFESLPGDIFQLGNMSYRIVKTEPGKMFVEDAQVQSPNIPFWLGEAPGRSDALSIAVSRLRDALDQQLGAGDQAAVSWVNRHLRPGGASAAEQLVQYLSVARTALAVVPSQQRVVFERFFDETGDMHLVVHSSFGSRVNRAWGLALRKRFCRKFNFELQAAALEDCIILSLGATHSFALEEVARYLNSRTVQNVLVQALLDAPMFETHWRWVVTTALAVLRRRGGKKVPAQFQRNDAEDLIALVFPDQIACLENIAGERDVPDHPLVAQTLDDCLNEVMDISGLERVLAGIEQQTIAVVCRDVTTPSVLAQEVLNARPFAFLDDAPAEERRTLAVRAQRYTHADDVGNLSRIDPEAVARVCKEVWPRIRDADELHDALQVHGFLREQEIRTLDAAWRAQLIRERRASSVVLASGQRLWVSAERLSEMQAVHLDARVDPEIPPLRDPRDADWLQDSAACVVALVRSRLQALGPVTVAQCARDLGVDEATMTQAFTALEQDGYLMRGVQIGSESRWCERGTLARIHRYSLQRARQASTAVPVSHYLRQLFAWHGVQAEKPHSPEALPDTLQLLAGYPLTATAWGQALQSRLAGYQAADLDALCVSGRYVWFLPALGKPSVSGDSLSRSAVVVVAREDLPYWQKAGFIATRASVALSSSATALLDILETQGASFFADLVAASGQLRSQTEGALCELVSAGLVHADSFAGLRALALPVSKRPTFSRFGKRTGARGAPTVDDAGRWNALSRLPGVTTALSPEALRLDYPTLEYFISAYLQRYGVIFRKLLEREAVAFSWRDLLPVLQRLEARGDIRGGRFVDGFSGIQFALAEFAATCGKAEAPDANQTPLCVMAATDPLNLTGTLLPGKRVAATAGNRLVFREGQLLAHASGDAISYIDEGDVQLRAEIQRQLQVQSKIARPRFQSR